MTDKEFEIGDTTYTVTVSSFTGSIAGNTSGLPENCFPGEAAEIEFDTNVEYAKNGDLETKTMPFDDFVEIYAADKGVDIAKAEVDIEELVVSEMDDSYDDYDDEGWR